MKNNKDSIIPLLGGCLFLLAGIISLLNVFRGAFHFRTILAVIGVLADFGVGYVVLSKRRDGILPICFSVLTILAVFSLFFSRGITAYFFNLLRVLANAFLAVLCWGELAGEIAKPYNDTLKKLWFLPAVLMLFGSSAITALAHIC